jgi:hypothetical protein
MSDIVKWREGFSVRGLSAKRAREEIERIRARKGGSVQPEDVVAAARAKASPLHAAFCWDDTKAARLYRLTQARNVLSAIIVVHKDEGPARQYVHHDKHYIPTVEALETPGTREDVLERALSELESMVARYRAYRRLAGLMDDVKLVVKKYRESVPA